VVSISFAVFVLLSTAALGAALTRGAQEPSALRVLVVFYSQSGNTEKLARAVAEGARSVDGVEVELKRVGETSERDVLAADAIVLGSPVYNANVAPAVQEFINGWPFRDAPLRDKVGAAFVTAGAISAGEEIVQMNILHSMLVFGMIVVGGPTWRQAFGASAIVAEDPAHGSDGAEERRAASEAYFHDKGKALGARVAELAVRLGRRT
jgi:NAD(P)H dehydrogenase (quinone)